MPLPHSPLFEDFVSRSRIIQAPDDDAVLLSAPVNTPPLYLQCPQGDLPLDAVKRAISKELARHGCDSSDPIALAVLANGVACRPTDTSAVAHLDACIAETHDAELHQYVVLPQPCRPTYDISLGPVRIAPFNPERLHYWSARGRSAFPFDLRSLAGRVALERLRFSTRMVRWDAAPAPEQGALSLGALVALRDTYYSAVFDHHLSLMVGAINQDLLVLEAGALLGFDAAALLRSAGAQKLGLFYWLSQAGAPRTWAVYSWMGELVLNLIPPELVAECRRWIKEDVGFDGFDLSTPFHRTVASFSDMLRRAQRHRVEGRPDEAGLHFVVALDLVFAAEAKLAASVADGAAVIAHRPLGRPFPEQLRHAKAVYDARSKYVHEGQPFATAQAEEAERIALEVLWALLNVAGSRRLSTTGEWVRKVNFVAAALKDDRKLPEEEFQQLGVGTRGRTPPNRVTGPAAS